MNRYRAKWGGASEASELIASSLSVLLTAVSGATFFDSREWTRCAASHALEGRALHVLYVEKDDRVVACLFLTYGKEIIHGLTVRTLRILGDPLADRHTFAIADGEEGLLEILFDALVRCPLSWDAIILSELAQTEDYRERIDRWGAVTGISLHWRHSSRSPILDITFADEGSLRASYPSSLSTRLRRARKKLDAAGTVSFRRYLPLPGEVDKLIGEFKQVEDASWKGGQGVGIFSTADHFRFYRELSVDLAEKGMLDVGELRLDGRLISYRYGFRYRDAFLDYNLAYSSEYSNLSPGRILLDFMIVSSLETGLKRVDGSRGSLQQRNQLQEWTDRYIDHYQLWIFSGRLRGKLLGIARNWVRPGILQLKAKAGFG